MNFNDGQLHVIQDQNDPKHVLVIFKGQAILRLPSKLAKEFAKVLQAAAAKCEMYEDPHKLILQDALLARTGAPFALSEGKFREEALKEAQWGEARTQMPLNPLALHHAATAGIPSLQKEG